MPIVGVQKVSNVYLLLYSLIAAARGLVSIRHFLAFVNHTSWRPLLLASWMINKILAILAGWEILSPLQLGNINRWPQNILKVHTLFLTLWYHFWGCARICQITWWIFAKYKFICQHLYWWKQGLKIVFWEKSKPCILFAVCSYVILIEFARKYVFIIFSNIFLQLTELTLMNNAENVHALLLKLISGGFFKRLSTYTRLLPKLMLH